MKILKVIWIKIINKVNNNRIKIIILTNLAFKIIYLMIQVLIIIVIKNKTLKIKIFCSNQ